MKSGISKATLEELEIINKNYAKKPLTEEDIYVFSVNAASSGQITAYYSYLGTDMIEAFHRDVHKRDTNDKAPIIGYLFGHSDQTIPSGTLFKSELITENVDGKEVKRFKPTVFMPKNLNVGGINTDDYIKAYESGTTEDCSVGFLAASYICDLCQYDIRDFWNCGHVPGRSYVTNEAEVENGASPITKQCTYTVHQGFVKDHNLMELSGVYRGAMWGARIEPSNLSIENRYGFAKKDENGATLISTNIKDFKASDILRFNFQFDGSIEKIGSIEKGDEGLEMENKLKEKDVEIQNLKTMIELSNKEDEAGQVELEKLRKEISDLQAKLQGIEAELKKAKDDLELCGKNLAQSEVEKVELQQKLDEANKEIERLGIELKHRVELVDQYIADLRGRCKKLSIQINGTSFNEGFFDKEISTLSVGELNQKISILEEQLAQMIPVGRKTVVTDKVHQGILGNNATQQNPDLYKIK